MVNEALRDGAAAATVDELSGQTLLAGGIWVVASSALPQIYVLASSILIARFLTVDDMGHQSYIAFVSISLVMICSFGLSGSFVRYGGELLGQGRLGTLRGLAWWILKIQFFCAIFSGLVIGAIGMFSHDLRASWMWAAVGAPFAIIQNVPTAVLSVLRRWRQASIITLVIGFAFTVGIAVVLAAGGGVAGVFAVGTLLGVVAAAWTTLIARRYLYAVAPRSEPHDDYYRPIISYAATIWAGFLLTFVVLRRSEFFVLDRYSSAKAIAYYSVAFAIVSGLAASVESLAGVVAPTVASLHGSGETDRIGPSFSRAVRLVLLVSVPLSAFGIAFGPALIRVIYGSDYTRTAAPLRIMLAAFPLVALMSLCGGLLWGSGRVRVWLLVFCFAAVVDVSLDFLLIPAHAEIGAAFANIGAQVTASLLVVGYTVRMFGPLDWQTRVLARALVAAVVAAAVGWIGVDLLAGVPGIAAGGAGAVVVFAGLSRLMRTVPATDGAWIASSVRGRLGGRIAAAVRLATVAGSDELIGS